MIEHPSGGAELKAEHRSLSHIRVEPDFDCFQHRNPEIE